ncbi:phosphoribosylformylglycinamidine cyclo-ligase [Dellaglioa sp. P0083]|uniref:phosphoribosylformylglycinamidine cyclo-ligase n=1 Tax=Dellaglioa kimchii TaxID=3344667 RepID=UPI0038D4F2B7
MVNAYQKSGVDVNAGYDVVNRINKQMSLVNETSTVGGFGGLFDLGRLGIKEPLMVSGTDGVGTKLMVAFETNRHDTIGIDCVAMCVNDIVAQGATPLYFLDYLATGKTEPQKIESIISGVIKGCQTAHMDLIGGETAEMPGMYQKTHYDMAGFAVGVVEKSQLIDGHSIQENDILIGISSTGIHSNGFSLVRKIFLEDTVFNLDEALPEIPDETLAEILMTPTKIYVDDLTPLFQDNLIKGAAHITGGGFIENVPRMLPEGLKATINLGLWPVLPIFDAISKYGEIPYLEMYEIFNMGIGMVLAVDKANVEQVMTQLNKETVQAYEIGCIDIKNTDQTVELVGK